MAENVKVRAETPIFGIAWGQEATLERTPAVAAAIEEGRLTLLGSGGTFLRGEALEQALRDAGLSMAGTANEKRARLADWRERPVSYQVTEGASTVTSEEAAVGAVPATVVVQPGDGDQPKDTGD
jgi:hypothetical protein